MRKLQGSFYCTLKKIGVKDRENTMNPFVGIFDTRLNNEEANNMVKEVSNKEVKEALFDIDDEKAPDPDGFTAKFFKAVWEIVGNDLCKAVQEFFMSGKLLGEVNATVIFLVPKINVPNRVSDFRPIACCNIIYICISKLITNRRKGILGKLVSENQSAFISGRKITDNILLSQELLRGYNWKNTGKKYAFKIDLQKAYDTTDWDFLRNTLKGFGFHEKMVNWVMICVTTAKFTINVNGERFVKVVMKALEEFISISGLKPNMQKSTAFFGVPLITKKISVSECRPLIDKVKQETHDWKNMALSYAGRLQLIALVLSSMQVYWASVFLLPRTIIKDINKLLKGFLWCHGYLIRGKAKVSWESICKPKDKGGLRLKSL
ncbi:RNA-directed DNA polymerase, eukaryota, reverse transcriptase zinc-binding domain protein [Tanacetum coccineum]|uniref:RNA-directed DNA polymerase, eukaryota, reverse transcriptase zinc-binding domain protein n=1 Tax=Tanacetum coccineum TaxID=301880 RepID=A0ABQ5CHW5_9ASTR